MCCTCISSLSYYSVSVYECVRAEEGNEEKMKEKGTSSSKFYNQKKQRCTVRLKEHGAQRYRKDKGAPRD